MNMNRIEKARRQITRIPYNVDSNGCHIPSGRVPNYNGRINTTFEGKQMNLSRLVAFAYLDLNLEDPKCLALHKNECHNKLCSNKEHLYVGNHSDNTNDAVSIGIHFEASKTHCPKGHLIDGVSNNRRFCRICKRANSRQRHARLRKV